MDEKLIVSIIKFIKKYPNYKTDSCSIDTLGQAWFSKIFENDDTRIIFKNERKCSMVNPFPEFLPDGRCIKVPDYTNITDTYTITIIYQGQTVYQDFISEILYIGLCNFGKPFNNSNNFNKTATLTKFINKYYV